MIFIPAHTYSRCGCSRQLHPSSAYTAPDALHKTNHPQYKTIIISTYETHHC